MILGLSRQRVLPTALYLYLAFIGNIEQRVKQYVDTCRIKQTTANFTFKLNFVSSVAIF